MAKSGTARGKRKKKDPRTGKVMYCEKCGTTEHQMVKDIGNCYGGIYVVEGRDWRWIRG